MFSVQDHSSVVPVSPIVSQPTTYSMSTIAASSSITTDSVATQSAGASPLPSPTDAGGSMGLSKSAFAGLAAATTALIVILIVGASKFLLKLKERRQRKAREETAESPMLFWDKTPSASRLSIPIVEPQELDGSQLCTLAGRQGKTMSSERCLNRDNQDRLMSCCWPDRPWVPQPTYFPMS